MSREAFDDEGYVGHSFLDLSPLRRQQSPFLSNEKELPPIPKLSKFTSFPYSTSTPTVNYIKRISLFFLLELAFIITGAVSLRKPLFIGFLESLDEAKGGFTVLFILWQTIAVFPLQHIILCIFSHEWSIQWSRTKTPLRDPNRIDQASVLTATAPERIRYLIRGHSSNSFKLAFATSLVLLGLVKLGPGAIGVAPVRQNRRVPVIMGKLSLTSQVPTATLSLVLQRAQMIVGLEQLGSSSYGFEVPSNYIIGWPSQDSRNIGAEMSYPSDVVKFNYTCGWEAPVLTGEKNIMNGGGIRWMIGQATAQLSPNGGADALSIFSPLLTDSFTDRNHTRRTGRQHTSIWLSLLRE